MSGRELLSPSALMVKASLASRSWILDSLLGEAYATLMKQVFVSQNLIEVEMRKERLEQAGIQCVIKNQRSSGLAGEIPFVEIFPELWVIQDEDAERAQQLFQEGLVSMPSNQDTWTCPGCGERHESQFGTCWNCEWERPSS